MIGIYLGLKTLSLGLKGSAALLRALGPAAGVSKEELEMDKIKAQREYRQMLREYRAERKAEAKEVRDGRAKRAKEKREMRKRAYARVLQEENNQKGGDA